MKRRRLVPLRSSKSFTAFVLDQLAELDVTSRAMFGGVGLYSRDLFFGIIASDALFLKVDDTNRARFIKAGMTPFKPNADGAGTMKYYGVPLEVLESAAELERWARSSIAVARQAARTAANRPVSRVAPRPGGRPAATKAKTPKAAAPRARTRR